MQLQKTKQSLYIHIPFCEKKCFYCSFVVSIGQKDRINRYLQCLSKEARSHHGLDVQTVYVGGGTPTFMDDGQIAELVKTIRTHFRLSDDAEFTIEANPEGIDFKKAQNLLNSGFNRISLGVQSLNDKYLKFLGRCHDRKTALSAYENLRKAGFTNVNLDLMYAFPGQTKEEIAEDVFAICDLKSDHLSLYNLMIEENSRFYVKKVQLQDDDRQADYYQTVTEILEDRGFRQYEISNFARPGKESRHNLNYWQGGEYIGLGIGAHSYQNGRRYWNTAKLTTYISKINNGEDTIEDSEELSPEELLIESILFGLRMNQGVNIEEKEKKFNCHLISKKRDMINRFIKDGFLTEEGSQIRTNLKGRLVLDELSARLI